MQPGQFVCYSDSAKGTGVHSTGARDPAPRLPLQPTQPRAPPRAMSSELLRPRAEVQDSRATYTCTCQSSWLVLIRHRDDYLVSYNYH